MFVAIAKPFSSWYSLVWMGSIKERFLEFISTLRSSKALSLAVILVLIAAIPLTVYISQKQQDIRQRAATNIPEEKNNQLVGALKVKQFGDKFFVEPPTSTEGVAPSVKMQISADQVVELGGQDTTGSIREAAKSYGYIIELKNDPLVKYQTSGVIRVQAAIEAHRATLVSEHEDAKRDILARLGKKSVALPQNASPESLALLGEYTGTFNGLALNITKDQVKEVKNSPFVKNVFPNYEVKASLMDSVPLINADDVWQINDNQGKKVTGEGTTIAIIDTGIDYTHSDLGGCLGNNCKVIGGYDFINYDNDPMDDYGHGTHVAAIAAGGSSLAAALGGGGPTPSPFLGPLKGVAPGAKLAAYKVLDQNGSGWDSGIISAIERSVDPNQDGNFSDHWDVINLSLGGFGDPDDPMSTAIDNATNAGVVAVIAAGNSGAYGKYTIGSPGTARKAITVGATDKSDSLAYFSSQGPVVWYNENKEGKVIVKPDVVAPGVNICAAQWDSWLNDRKCIDNNHISISGTSMASPHVAGVAALIKQKHPDWNPAQIKAVLKNKVQNITGKTVIERGSGRIDALLAVNESDFPPVAELDQVLISGKNRTIAGRIQTKDIKQWSLSYASLDATKSDGSWIELNKSTSLPTSGELYTVSTESIIDGDYIIRLLVEDIDGQRAIDYGYLYIDKLQLASLRNSDIWRAGDEITITPKIYEGITPERLTLEYGLGENPSQWIAAVGGPAAWNTAGLETGWYTLRLTMNQNGINDIEAAFVYLDATLKKGWPQRLSWPPDMGSSYLEPVVSDLDGDGKKEIVVFNAGEPPKLYVYRLDGTILWSADVGSALTYGGNLHIPLVEDLDGDGKKEILAYNIGTWEQEPYYSELYAFDSGGKVLSGWPVRLPKIYKLTILSADLDRDGKKEIVLRGDGQMIILGTDGKVLSQWDLPQISWGASLEGTPAVGNFDNDKDLEIVVARPSANAGWNGGWVNEGEVFVFNMDGTNVAGWPIKVPSNIFSSSAVGDLNNDGQQEIVVGLMYASETFPDTRYGGLYVFDRNGKVLPGWPVMKGYNYWSSPSLGDLDGDGDLEIATSRLGFYTEVYNHDGKLLDGWPQKTEWNDYYSTIMGDINGDKIPDLLTTAGAKVYGWTVKGKTITGFPKTTENGSQAPAVIDDLDGDGKLEVIASSDLDFDNVKKVYKRRGSVYVWELLDRLSTETMHWPTFHHDVQRTGMYPVSSRACIQVITPAKNPQTGECRDFPTPCDVSQGWIKVSSCEALLQSFTIAQGWNLVGLTVDKGTDYKAEDLLRDLNSSFVPRNVPNKQPPSGNKITQITKFDSSRDRYVPHEVGSEVNNFSITPGEGYFVKSIWPGTVTLSGTQASLSSLTIARGWSIISFPKSPAGIATAENLLQAMKNQGVDVRQINRWFGGRYVPYQFGNTANNFSITPGEGYFIRNFGEAKTFDIP